MQRASASTFEAWQRRFASAALMSSSYASRRSIHGDSTVVSFGIRCVLADSRAFFGGASCSIVRPERCRCALSTPIVVTVHDLAWHNVQAHAPAYARYYFGWYSLTPLPARLAGIRRFVLYSRRVAAVRRTTRSGRVKSWFIQAWPTISARSIAQAGDGRTILAVGTVERRKNLEVLDSRLESPLKRAADRDGTADAVRRRVRATRAPSRRRAIA